MVIWPSAAYAMPDPSSPVVPAGEASATPDLRSPDARDGARNVAVAPADSTRVSATRSVSSVSDGFEWSDAGIGAATFALSTVAGGTVLLVGRSRRRAPTT